VELEITLEIIVAADFLMNDAKYIGLDVHQATTCVPII
jgi:hypothetical protein